MHKNNNNKIISSRLRSPELKNNFWIRPSVSDFVKTSNRRIWTCKIVCKLVYSLSKLNLEPANFLQKANIIFFRICKTHVTMRIGRWRKGCEICKFIHFRLFFNIIVVFIVVTLVLPATIICTMNFLKFRQVREPSVKKYSERSIWDIRYTIYFIRYTVYPIC